MHGKCEECGEIHHLGLYYNDVMGEERWLCETCGADMCEELEAW